MALMVSPAPAPAAPVLRDKAAAVPVPFEADILLGIMDGVAVTDAL